MSADWRTVRAPVLLAAIFAAGVAAIQVAPVGSHTAMWWPAAGLASVLVIGTPRRAWPPLLALLAVVVFASNLVAGRDLVVSIVFGAANAAEALVVATALGAHRRRPELRHATDLARLCAAALAGASVLALTAGLTVSVVVGADLWSTARNLVASHVGSQLLILPVALAGADLAVGRSRRADLMSTGAAALTLAAFVGVFVWGHLPALAFLPLPALVWAALLLPRRRAFALVLTAGVVVTVATSRGVGPLAIDADLAPTAVGALAQLYLVVLFFVAVPLVVVVDQRTSALAVATAVLRSTTANAIIGLDPVGRIRFFNVGAEKMLGWTADEVVGGRPSDFYVDPGAVDEYSARKGISPGLVGLREALEDEGGVLESDWTWTRKDGSSLSVSVAVTVIRSETGAVEGYLAVATDVTERLEVKRRLREALAREQASVAELERVDRLKDDFVSAVSHELRTPLTTILGTTQLMAEHLLGSLSPAQEDGVERIHRNGRRLLMLIEDLLTLTAAESRATGRSDEVRAADVLDEVARQADDLVGGRDLGIGFLDDSRGAVVRGDVDQLERALLNLVGNAVKFTPSGGRVDVTARVEGDELVWRVRDTGIGIRDDEADHLFDRFFRSREVVQAAIPGTGLGLSIVRTVAEAHGGTANRVPHEGPGTSFELRLPLARPIPTSAQVTSVEVPT